MSVSPQTVPKRHHAFQSTGAYEFPALNAEQRTPTAISSASIVQGGHESLAAARGQQHGDQPSDRHGTEHVHWEAYSRWWRMVNDRAMVWAYSKQADHRPNGWAEDVKAHIRTRSETWSDVSADTVEHALSFVDALPPGTVEPNVEPTPQGEIDFAWDNGDRTFGVVVEPSGELGFAGMYDKVNLYGNVPWNNKNDLPEFVMIGIRWVHGNDL